MPEKQLTTEQESINQSNFEYIGKPIDASISNDKITYNYAKAIGDMNLLINVETVNDQKSNQSSNVWAIEDYDDILTIHLFTTNALEQNYSPFRLIDSKYTTQVVQIEQIHEAIQQQNIENNELLVMIHNGETGKDTLSLKPDDIEFVYTQYINPTHMLGGVNDPFKTIIEKFGQDSSNKKIKNIYAIRTFDKKHAENYNLELYVDFDNSFDKEKISELKSQLIQANDNLSAQIKANQIQISEFQTELIRFIEALNLNAIVYHRLTPWENILKLAHKDTSTPS